MGTERTRPPGLESLLSLGDPELRQIAEPVENPRDPAVARAVAKLQAALQAFRSEHGFGRAISAPQIGEAGRVLALHVERGPSAMINPEITWRSGETFTLWDDCMSFPHLLVRLRRHRSISVHYLDEQGEERVWEKLDADVSELLQHEIDHLDGVLALDRALDRDAIISREAFERRPELFSRLVDTR